MARNNNSQETADRISSDLAKRMFDEIEDYSKHENFRKRVKEIFDDCINSVPFMKRVKEYAGEEIENRIYKSIDFWLKTAGIPIVVTIITSFAIKYLKLT